MKNSENGQITNIALRANRKKSNTEPQEIDMYTLPSSPATRLYAEILGAGMDIANIGERKRKVNHGATYEVSENGDKRRVTMRNKTDEITIEIENIGELTGNNKALKKLFAFFLIKTNEQALHNGELSRFYISFPLKELVDIGLYENEDSARKGFKENARKLTKLSVSGIIKKSKKNTYSIEGQQILFIGWKIINGQCQVNLNFDFNWGFIAQYYSCLPVYYFSLPNRAADLLDYIFYLARQNTRKIKEQGYFTIGFRAIQAELHLPSEVGNRKPKQQIKDPIEKAVKEIEAAHREYYNNQDLSLTLVFDENTSISDYLDNGYLKITLKGDFAKRFIELSQKRTQKIQAAEKRQKKIEDTAKAKNLAKKLEEQEKQGAANG